jgi:NADH-quinone oxidoreductase subunit J
MVLFLFVIMLLGVEQLRKGSALPWQQTLAIISGLLLLALTAYVIFIRPTTLPQVSPTQLGFGTPGAIGEILFNKYLLPFEVTSVLLLVAMIGAIVLTGKREPKAKT